MSGSKFYGGLDTKQCFIVHGVSLRNDKQIKPEYRREYLELIRRHQSAIVDYIELIGDELLALYGHPQEEVDAIVKQIKTIYPSIEKSDYLSWYTLSEQKDYQRLLSNIKLDYQNNTEFKNIVDNLVNKHAFKKDKQAALTYILNECAGFLSLPDYIRKQFKLDESTDILLVSCSQPKSGRNW